MMIWVNITDVVIWIFLQTVVWGRGVFLLQEWLKMDRKELK